MMKKYLFLLGLLLAYLPLRAVQIYLPSDVNTYELHSGDTVRLDTAGTYRFFQTVDTLYDILILSEVKYVPEDTTCQRIFIKDLNIKNHNTEVRTSGICCVRLEDSIGVATFLYVDGENILCPGLSYGYHHPSAIGCGIRVNTPISTTITGPGTLVYAPYIDGFYGAEVSGCLIGICDDSGKCTISVDSIATTYTGTTYKYDIHWGSYTLLTIHSSKYGEGIKYGTRYSVRSCISIDADSCASLIGSTTDSLFVYRGNINKITGFAYAEIGVDSNPDIHIKNIGTDAPLHTKVYSGKVDAFRARNTQRLDLHGGLMCALALNSVMEQATDTIFHMTGGTLLLENINYNLCELGTNSRGRVVIDGGIIENPSATLHSNNCLWTGIRDNKHDGNIYLNQGKIRVPMPNAAHIFVNDTEQDTIFTDGKAIVNHGANMILRTLNTTIYMDSISSIQQIVSNQDMGTWKTPNFIPLLKISNSTTGDSLCIIDSEGKSTLTLPDIAYSPEYDVWDIYPAYNRVIHYQVGDGVAPKDSTYQEGLVRYFTTVPTRPFYDFVGWYADSTYTIRVDSLDQWSRGDTTLWAKWEHSREIPSLSIMIAQGSCLAVRNPEGLSELDSAYYTWVHQDTIRINGVDSIISDTLPSHKMYVEVGDPIPQGWYTAIIHIEEGWTVRVTRYIPATVLPISSPRNSNKRTLFYIGSYIFGIDDEGKKYLIKP